MSRFLCCLLLLHGTCLALLEGSERASWRLDLASDAHHEVIIDGWAMHPGRALDVRWQSPADVGEVWLEVCLITSDERFFATAMAIAGHRHSSIRVPLRPGYWHGPDGLLDDDALRGVRAAWVRVHGVSRAQGRLTGSLAVVDDQLSPRPLAIRLIDQALIDRGPWHEVHLQVVGDLGHEATVTLVGDGHQVPGFVGQRGTVVAGRWRARGASHWVFRLRPEELPVTAWRVVVARAGQAAWRSSPLPLNAATAIHQPLPDVPQGLLAMPISAGWQGHYVLFDPGAGCDGERRHGCCEQPALAPQLFWRDAWTGFRGRRAVAHPYALQLDHHCVTAVDSIDLLPQSLFEEHGAFRFGLSPLHVDADGPWHSPLQAFADDEALEDLLLHAREIIARARAAPQLRAWRISCVQNANDPAQRRRLHRFTTALVALLQRYDGQRPLEVRHPQAVTYARLEADGQPWISFEPGEGGHPWLIGTAAPPPPTTVYATQAGRSRAVATPPNPALRRRLAPITQHHASHGQQSLRLVVHEPVDGAMKSHDVAVVREVDANLFNLDRLELDVLLEGSGAIQLYCWVTDAEHRWYQQALAPVRAEGRWQTLGVDFSAHGDWEAVGHDRPWTGDQRRRIRLLGFTGHAYHRPDEEPRRTHLHIDALRRFGWPHEPAPDPSITLRNHPASATAHASLRVDFDIDLPVANPYDADQADVVGELRHEDGRVIRHPAFWYRPVALVMEDGHEQARLDDDARWQWRIAVPEAGSWQWRLVARLRYREEVQQITSAWHDLTVAPPDAQALLPVRQDDDPAWWRTEDGRWFYPLGINLRSPGDERQDVVLASAGLPQRSADWERLGTRAYADWFATMQEHRLNFARVWMSPWWCGLEWGKGWDEFGGLGVYNQAAAARLDAVMDMARQHGIYIQLELQNHGMTSTDVDQQWGPDEENPGSPYNIVNGGPCVSVVDFFRNETAWTHHANRLRYTQARWGHASHLMAWVLTSEIEFTGAFFHEAYRPGYHDPRAHSPTTEAWVRRSLDWFSQHDYRQRPVSIHFSHPWRGRPLWEVEGLGFSYSNAYTGFQTDMRQLGGPRPNLAVALHHYLDRHFPPQHFNRPTMIGEWGGHWQERSATVLDAELRTGLWTQAVMPYAGNVGFWWWLWVDAAQRWGDYRAIAAFLADDDPRGQGYQTYRPRINRMRGQARAEMIGMYSPTSHRYYAWLSGLDRNPAVSDARPAGSAQVMTGQPHSLWQVERWDCSQGVVVSTSIVSANEQGVVELDLGQLAPDAAFKLERRAR